MIARKTLTRFYIYAVLSGLQFTWTTWLAYVVAHGGNPGWAEASFHLAIWLGEVPTGAVADILGRRTSMIVGLAVGILQPLLYFWIHDTTSACIALAFSGLGGTFLSGADTALLYETAEEVGGSELARKALARVSALQLGTMSISPVIAGFLYSWHDWAPAVTRAFVCLIAILVVWGMTERRNALPPEGRPSLWTQTRAAVIAVRQNRLALSLMIFGWGYNTAIAMTNQFGQAYFPSIGLSMAVAGFVFSIGHITSTGTSALASRVSATFASRFLRFAPLGLALCLLGMGVSGAWLGALFFVIIGSLDGMLWPIHQFQFNEAIPSAQRATILSLQSSGFSMLMMVSFPAASYLRPVSQIYVVTGIATLILAVIWALRRWSVASKAETVSSST